MGRRQQRGCPTHAHRRGLRAPHGRVWRCDARGERRNTRTAGHNRATRPIAWLFWRPRAPRCAPPREAPVWDRAAGKFCAADTTPQAGVDGNNGAENASSSRKTGWTRRPNDTPSPHKIKSYMRRYDHVPALVKRRSVTTSPSFHCWSAGHAACCRCGRPSRQASGGLASGSQQTAAAHRSHRRHDAG